MFPRLVAQVKYSKAIVPLNLLYKMNVKLMFRELSPAETAAESKILKSHHAAESAMWNDCSADFWEFFTKRSISGEKSGEILTSYSTTKLTI